MNQLYMEIGNDQNKTTNITIFDPTSTAELEFVVDPYVAKCSD